MKVSKIKHARNAICKRKDSLSIGGRLYDVPNKKNQEQSIENYINNAIEGTKKFYTPFKKETVYFYAKKEDISAEKIQDEKVDELKSKIEKEITFRFEKTITRYLDQRNNYLNQTNEDELKRIIKNEWINAGKNIKKENEKSEDILKQYFSDLFALESNGVSNQADFIYNFLTALFNMKLKRTISKEYVANGKHNNNVDTLTKGLMEFSNLAKGKKYNCNSKKFLYVLAAIREDYAKDEQAKSIAKSIKDNNVKVQVDKSQKDKLLTLPCAIKKEREYRNIDENLKMFAEQKNNVVLAVRDSIPVKNKITVSKDTLFKYVKDFVSECKTQNDKIGHMRCLIILFICGVEAYKKAVSCKQITDDFWGNILPVENVYFNSKIDEYLQEMFSLEGQYKTTSFLRKKIKDTVNNDIKNNFRTAIAEISGNEFDVYWMKYIQSTASKLLSNIDKLIKRNDQTYLCKAIYREWTSYLASKYIDMGKAVYNFTIPHNLSDLGNDIEFGKLLPEYKSGINSFHYEYIKAKENVHRSLAIASMYSVAVFSNNAVSEESRKIPKKEDVLAYSVNDFQKLGRENQVQRILQFFGGKSKWSSISETDYEFMFTLKRNLAVARNYSFHFAPSMSEVKEQYQKLALNMFNKEFSRINRLHMEKYYNNNVPVFYGKKSIINMLDFLYVNEVVIPEQIPSFNNVFPVKESNMLIHQWITSINSNGGYDLPVLTKFRQAFRFALKEIYYKGFLSQPDLYDKFIVALKAEKQEIEDNIAFVAEIEKKSAKSNDKLNAINNFSERVDEIKTKDFGMLCQQLMVDYEMQNQGRKSVLSTDRKEKAEKRGNKEKYQHFKMILWKMIRKAFKKYIDENCDVFGFLKEPSYKENYTSKVSFDEFADSWNTPIKMAVTEVIKNNVGIRPWYFVAHFLHPKQLNHLKGAVKSYIQFVKDINKRAKSIDCSSISEEDMNIAYYEQLLLIFDFVSLFVGRVSNNIEDYFPSCQGKTSKEIYIEYINKYIEYDPTDENSVFFDEVNPIVNRAVVFSLMYGADKVLSSTDVHYMVSQKEYDTYIQLQKSKSMKNIFSKERCENIEEQKKLNEFQQLKNRVELHDLYSYTEMIIDHMAQLVSYAYMRERDLMYFQLGIQYIRLYHCKVVPEGKNKLRCLSNGSDINIKNGAILYQIIAMYNHDLKVFSCDENGNIIEDNKNTGDGVGMFLSKNGYGGYLEYINALQLFAINYDGYNGDNEFDRMHKLRNSIAHMKYFVGEGRSIIDYYTEIYNGFFRYSSSLRKSIGFIFDNIMMRYFIVTNISLDNIEKGKKRKVDIDSMVSDKFTYKYATGEEKLPVHNQQYMDIARNILYYKT